MYVCKHPHTHTLTTAVWRIVDVLPSMHSTPGRCQLLPSAVVPSPRSPWARPCTGTTQDGPASVGHTLSLSPSPYSGIHLYTYHTWAEVLYTITWSRVKSTSTDKNYISPRRQEESHITADYSKMNAMPVRYLFTAVVYAHVIFSVGICHCVFTWVVRMHSCVFVPRVWLQSSEVIAVSVYCIWYVSRGDGLATSQLLPLNILHKYTTPQANIDKHSSMDRS